MVCFLVDVSKWGSKRFLENQDFHAIDCLVDVLEMSDSTFSHYSNGINKLKLKTIISLCLTPWKAHVSAVQQNLFNAKLLQDIKHRMPHEQTCRRCRDWCDSGGVVAVSDEELQEPEGWVARGSGPAGVAESRTSTPGGQWLAAHRHGVLQDARSKASPSKYHTTNFCSNQMLLK